MKHPLLLFLLLTLLSCNNNSSNHIQDKVKSENTAKEKENAKSIDNKLGVGKITSIADGFDVQVVNLWSSTISSRTIVGKMYQGDTVIILKDAEPYYYLELVKSKVKGYCMKGFVIMINY
jgi:hypothetical protein